MTVTTDVAVAVALLTKGQLCAIPTETVYGLAANALDVQAVARVFQAKDRPPDHPLIVHVLSIDQVALFAADVPDFARLLMTAFWPGPLTLILPRRPGVAQQAAGVVRHAAARPGHRGVAQDVGMHLVGAHRQLHVLQ